MLDCALAQCATTKELRTEAWGGAVCSKKQGQKCGTVCSVHFMCSEQLWCKPRRKVRTVGVVEDKSAPSNLLSVTAPLSAYGP